MTEILENPPSNRIFPTKNNQMISMVHTHPPDPPPGRTVGRAWEGLDSSGPGRLRNKQVGWNGTSVGNLAPNHADASVP